MSKRRRKDRGVPGIDPKRAILDRARRAEALRKVGAGPDGPTAEAPVRREPLRAGPRPEDPLAVVKRRQRSYAAASRGRDQAVSEARAAGASWDAIGRATGLTADGARSRWGRSR